jgi:hypothetical protein
VAEAKQALSIREIEIKYKLALNKICLEQEQTHLGTLPKIKASFLSLHKHNHHLLTLFKQVSNNNRSYSKSHKMRKENLRRMSHWLEIRMLLN